MSVFTDPAASSVVPTVTATVVGDGGNAALSGPVSEWKIERELVGSVLPGSIRAISGLSIGSGDCVVRNPDPIRRTPWAAAERRIRAQMSVSLMATDGVGGSWSLGDWIVPESSGSLLSQEVPLSLVEGQFRGRGPARSVNNLLPAGPIGAALEIEVGEPSWVVDALARQCGYYSTPAPAPSAVGSIPMAGATWEEVSPRVPALQIQGTGWGGVRGALGPTGAHFIRGSWGVRGYRYNGGFYAPVPTHRLTGGIPIYHTLDVVGTELIHHGLVAANGFMQVEIRMNAVGGPELAVRAGSTRPWITAPFTAGLDPNYPQRVQVEVRRDGVPDDITVSRGGTFSNCRARIRSSHTAEWSAWAVDTWSGSSDAIEEVAIQGAAGSSFCGWQISTEPDPELWAAPTAVLEPLGGTLQYAYLPAGVDPWTGIQEVVAARLGAAYVDREGIFRLVNRRHLAGGVDPSTVRRIDVGRRVADLPWRVATEDEADRLEVTYQPVDAVSYVPNPEVPGRVILPILWEASEAYELQPFERLSIVIDPDRLGWDMGEQLGARGCEWSDLDVVSSTAGAEGEWSTWSARYYRDGSGGAIPGKALAVTSERVSAGRFRLTIVNRTSARLFTVNSEGQPHLRLRGILAVGEAEAVVIERGVSAEKATNPLTIDLGRWVQTAADAEAITDYLWPRTANPGIRLTDVEMVPDLRVDIGDVVYLQHGRSDLGIKALVTKVSRSGNAGSMTQICDFIALAPTYADLAAAWAGHTYAEMTAAWAGRTYADLTATPLDFAPNAFTGV